MRIVFVAPPILFESTQKRKAPATNLCLFDQFKSFLIILVGVIRKNKNACGKHLSFLIIFYGSKPKQRTHEKPTAKTLAVSLCRSLSCQVRVRQTKKASCQRVSLLLKPSAESQPKENIRMRQAFDVSYHVLWEPGQTNTNACGQLMSFLIILDASKPTKKVAASANRSLSFA